MKKPPEEVIVTNCVRVCPPRVFLRTRYNYNQRLASIAAGLTDFEPSKTDQSAKKESDINEIVRQFGLTGHMPTNLRKPLYGDFTGIGTYQEALEAVKTAEMTFMEFPAEFRAKFNHDPAEFLEYINDPKNQDETKRFFEPEKMAAEAAKPLAAAAEAANSSKAEKTTT